LSVDSESQWSYSSFIDSDAQHQDGPANSEAEIERVFSETRPLIQMALIHYRVGNRDGNVIERDLRLWFVRLVQRVNNSLTPVSAFRKYLLLATCEFAYSYQMRNPEAQADDARLREVLAKHPRVVAAELQKML
jgi:hypothetical protein